MLYAFATHEIGLSPTGAEDPLPVLSQREANATGKEQLLVALLRGAEIHARVVLGLELGEGQPGERVWTEVWTGQGWFPMSATRGFFGQLPPRFLATSWTGAPRIEVASAIAVARTYRALRVPLSEAELAALASPTDPLFRHLSLYRLSVATQATLRVLLLLPLGALAVALLRNVIGVPSYGTFMPMLIALALRGTGLGVGLLLLGFVLAVGIAGRLLLERLQLLLVPRLAFILSLVILAMVALALVGRYAERPDLHAGGFLPIVILTMLVERFSIKAAEEGLGTALRYAATSTAMAVLLYPIFHSTTAAHLLFGFPELILVIMGLLTWTGGYAGYRVADLLRFRSLLRERTTP